MKSGFLSENEIKFVEEFRKMTRGVAVEAVRRAGLGSTDGSQRQTAHRMMHNPEVVRALCIGIPSSNAPTCLHCGGSFSLTKSQQSYCSSRCRQNARKMREKSARPIKECPQCLTRFKPSTNQIYCSLVCTDEARRHRSGRKRRNKSYSKRDYNSEHWVSKAKVAIRALEELGIEI